MEKINAVLVVLSVKYLQSVLSHLNPKTANLIAVVIDGYSKSFIRFGGREVPAVRFADIQKPIDEHKDCIWLIRGSLSAPSSLYAMKKFLVMSGVPSDNVVNFTMMLSSIWIANFHYVKKNGTDFFATGISYTLCGLDLNSIPHAHGKAVNLAGSNQDLRQAYFTAKRIFEHFKSNPPPARCKFVIIGLAPYSFRYDNVKSFSVCPRNLQYMSVLNYPETSIHDHLLKILASDSMNKILQDTSTNLADLNFNRLKRSTNYKMRVAAILGWEKSLKNLTKTFFPVTVEENIQILQNYIDLCLANGAKPVGVVFPFTSAMQKNFDAELLSKFRETIRCFEETSDFTCIDLFDMNLDYDCFRDMAHLNLKGASLASSLLALKLWEHNLIDTESFCAMSPEYFQTLSTVAPADEYNALMEQVAKASDKINKPS